LNHPFPAQALTCQARPQEGEVFGEVPPRRDLDAHTRFPVLVPSAAAAYAATYDRAHLEASAGAAPPAAAPLVAAAKSRAARGYAALVAAYVADCAARGPARGGADRGGGPGRSVLFGVQRPPLGSATVLRCGGATTYDDLLPSLVPFETTTARDECVVAVDPANAALLAALDGARVRARVVAADDAAFAALAAGAYNVVPPDRLGVDADAAPLVQQFVSRLLPMGHVKSTTPDDAAFFAARVAASPEARRPRARRRAATDARRAGSRRRRSGSGSRTEAGDASVGALVPGAPRRGAAFRRPRPRRPATPTTRPGNPGEPATFVDVRRCADRAPLTPRGPGPRANASPIPHLDSRPDRTAPGRPKDHDAAPGVAPSGAPGPRGPS